MKEKVVKALSYTRTDLRKTEWENSNNCSTTHFIPTLADHSTYLGTEWEV